MTKSRQLLHAAPVVCLTTSRGASLQPTSKIQHPTSVPHDQIPTASPRLARSVSHHLAMRILQPTSKIQHPTSGATAPGHSAKLKLSLPKCETMNFGVVV